MENRKSPWFEKFLVTALQYRYIGNCDIRQMDLDDEQVDLIRRVWGLPQADEVSVIAVFTTMEREPLQGWKQHNQEDIEKLIFDIRTIDMSSIPAILSFSETHGPINSAMTMKMLDPFTEGEYNLYATLADRVNEGPIRAIEPLWFLIQRLSVIKIVCELIEYIRHGNGNSIHKICRIDKPMQIHVPDLDIYQQCCKVEFAPPWLLPETRRVLRNSESNSILVPFIPTQNKHYLAAAWLYVSDVIHVAMSEKVNFFPVCNIPKSVLHSIENISSNAVQIYNAMANTRAYTDNIDFAPPILELQYTSDSIETLIYLKLLDICLQGGNQKECCICGQFFVPASGHFKYCTRHDDAAKKKWRRSQQAKKLSKEL